MNADELCSKQAPIKDLYRQNPTSALITLHAEGSLGEGVSCSVDTGRALIEAGLHSATGGTGMQVCSGDMLLQALVACAGVTLSAVATSLEIPINSASLRAEGDLDFRGTLGVSKDIPVGFLAIRLYVTIDSPSPVEKINKLIDLTERYCVVLQTLRSSISVKTICNGA